MPLHEHQRDEEDRHDTVPSEEDMYVDLTKTPEGKLRIQLTDLGLQQLSEFEDFRDRFGIDAALRELLADHFEGGWEEVRPEELGALTSALLLCDQIGRDDRGKLVSVGDVYWNPLYAVMDEIEQLRQKSVVLFERALS